MRGKDFINAVARDDVDLLQLFLDLLAETGVEYCVIGGLAVNAYAEPVVSLDLDVVVGAQDINKICAAAEEKGLRAERFEHSINLTCPRSDLRIQLQTDSRYQAFLGRASAKEILGYTMKVATVEDVLQGKVWAYCDPTRRKSKRQKDLTDIVRLLEASPKLDSLLPREIRQALK